MKQIEGFPNYTIDICGNIYNEKNKKLSPALNNSGYYNIRLTKNGKTTNMLIHRLVAIAFIPNPDNLEEVNHEDGNKLNCHKDNLKWSSKKNNIQHSFKTGLNKRKLTIENVREIRSLKGKYKYQDIANMFGVSKNAIKQIYYGITWSYLD